MSVLSLASPRLLAALGTVCVWALAAASLMYWGLKLAAPPESSAPPALVSAPVSVDSNDVGKLFGAVVAPSLAGLAPEAGSRFVLLGVVADGDQRGAALIAIDGKPPRPFRVGQQVGDGFVLQSVDRRVAALGANMDAPAVLTLQLPKPSSAPSGVRPAAPAPAPKPGTGAAPGRAPAGAAATAMR